MSQTEIEKINSEWSKCLLEKGIESFMIYSPFCSYWEQNLKIMVCNLETYGYDECGIVNVNMDIFTQWMKATNITKTTRNTSVFVNAVKEAGNGHELEIKEIRESYYDIPHLIDVMKSISYMNIRKESNPVVNQDVNKIITEAREYKIFLKRYIHACEPDLFFVGGHVGVNVFNNIFEPEKLLLYNSEIEFENIRVLSIKHLSRINYDYIKKRIGVIFGNKKIA